MNRMEFESQGPYVTKADMAYYHQIFQREHPEGNSFMSTSPVNLPIENSSHSPYDQRMNERVYYSPREGDYQWEQHTSKNKEQFTNQYKNFNIIHTDHSNPQQMFNSVMTIQSVEYDNHSIGSKHEDEQKLKFALSNTNIGQILTESSREIDKINKMLEEHRRKKAMKHEHSPKENENNVQHDDDEDIVPNSAKENKRPKETILIEDSNLKRIKSQPHSNIQKPNLNINPLNNTAVLKELGNENISTKNTSAKRTNDTYESLLKKSGNQTLFRQASSGKLTGNKPKISTGVENKPSTPLESASKVSSTKSFLGQGYDDLKSPKPFVSEKGKSKSLNKDKNSSRFREVMNKREEDLQKVQRLSKNSTGMSKNSKREKENEEIFQKLSIHKHGHAESEYSKNQEIAIKQLKSLKGTSQEPRMPYSGNRDKKENTPYFKNKEQGQKIRREVEGLDKKAPAQYSQRRGLHDDYHMKNNMMIATGENPNLYKENMNKDNFSIPSSVKSVRTINLPHDSKQNKNATNMDLMIDVDTGATELIPQNRRESAYGRNKEFNQSVVQTSNTTLLSRNAITPNSKSIEPEKKAQSPTRSQISQANTIKIYNRILANPLYHSVETQKGPQVDEHKLEIIKNNLARLQKEYLLIAGNRRSGRYCDYGIESTLNINTNPQIVNINERLSKTSKHSGEVERFSNYTTQSSSKGTTTHSQESLMKSFLLRQNLLNQANAAASVSRSPQRGEQNNFESPKREIQGRNVFQQNIVGALSSHGKTAPEDEIYNRNSEWLSNKKNKIESMSSVKEKEEMKECTFRPNIFSKTRPHTTKNYEVNGHGYEGKLGMARSGHKVRGNGIMIESPRHDDRVLQTEPSSRKNKGQTATYRQMHESRKSQNVYLDESLSNYSNKASYISSKKV